MAKISMAYNYHRVFACFALLFLSGCSSFPGLNLGVKPWQRSQLSKESMKIDHSRLQNTFDQHIYFAREASIGGGSLGGGGCGCN